MKRGTMLVVCAVCAISLSMSLPAPTSSVYSLTTTPVHNPRLTPQNILTHQYASQNHSVSSKTQEAQAVVVPVHNKLLKPEEEVNSEDKLLLSPLSIAFLNKWRDKGWRKSDGSLKVLRKKERQRPEEDMERNTNKTSQSLFLFPPYISMPTFTHTSHTRTHSSSTHSCTSIASHPTHTPLPRTNTPFHTPKPPTLKPSPTLTHPMPTQTPRSARRLPRSSKGTKILAKNEGLGMNKTKLSQISSSRLEKHVNNATQLSSSTQRTEESDCHFFWSWEAALIVGLSAWWVAALSTLAFLTRTSLGQKIIETLCPLSCLARVEEEAHLDRIGFIIDGSPGMRRPSKELLLNCVYYDDDDWMVDLLVQKEVMDSENKGKKDVENMWENQQETSISQAKMAEILTKRLEKTEYNDLPQNAAMTSTEGDSIIMNGEKECERQNDDVDADDSDSISFCVSQSEQCPTFLPPPDSLTDPFELQRPTRKLSLIEEETAAL